MKLVVIFIYNLNYLYQYINYIQAKTDFKEAIAREETTKRYYGLGISNIETGDLYDAIEIFKKGMKIDEKDSELYYGIGRAYQTLGDEKNAISNFNYAIKYDSQNIKAYNLKALTLYGCGRLKEVIENNKKAMKIRAFDDLYMILGNSYFISFLTLL